MQSFFYKLKVAALKNARINHAWRYWNAWRGKEVGGYDRLPALIRAYAPGRSFVDIGCMWGVNGEFAFIAEQAGAGPVKGVDVFGPTPEFEGKRLANGSQVEFILGDACRAETLEQVGQVEVVFCAGVLYHHPSPFDLLAALRSICRETLILRTSTIPEIKGLPNAAVYYPMLSETGRQLWNLKSLGLARQVGITGEFEPQEGYGNWFWGLTPSALDALLATAGFKVDRRFEEPFAQTLICTPIEPPFTHNLPDRARARQMAEQISAAKIADPA